MGGSWGLLGEFSDWNSGQLSVLSPTVWQVALLGRSSRHACALGTVLTLERGKKC